MFLLEANNYQDGFEKVFEALKGIDDTFNTAAFIVIPWSGSLTYNTDSMTGHCKCYEECTPQELMTFLAPIYKKFNRPEPIVYLEIEHVDQTKTWVTKSNKANDLITSHYLVNGFEHSIVVIFNEKGAFPHNIAMRSTGILVVVDIPWWSWSKICHGFHKFSDRSGPRSAWAPDQGGRKQIFYGGAIVNSKKRIFKKFPKTK